MLPFSLPIIYMYVLYIAGVILHFNLPVLADYYIIDPQRWFELCALVISPNNVSKLIRSARKVERG